MKNRENESMRIRGLSRNEIVERDLQAQHDLRLLCDNARKGGVTPDIFASVSRAIKAAALRRYDSVHSDRAIGNWRIVKRFEKSRFDGNFNRISIPA